jgi:predicted DNA-binding protein
MVRKQMYLTQEQDDKLASLASERGKTQSQLLREAVDTLLEQARVERLRAALEAARGMWQDRDDLPDFAAMRAEDRGLTK